MIFGFDLRVSSVSGAARRGGSRTYTGETIQNRGLAINSSVNSAANGAEFRRKFKP
jgi:hypothetical protein